MGGEPVGSESRVCCQIIEANPRPPAALNGRTISRERASDAAGQIGGADGDRSTGSEHVAQHFAGADSAYSHAALLPAVVWRAPPIRTVAPSSLISRSPLAVNCGLAADGKMIPLVADNIATWHTDRCRTTRAMDRHSARNVRRTKLACHLSHPPRHFPWPSHPAEPGRMPANSRSSATSRPSHARLARGASHEPVANPHEFTGDHIRQKHQRRRPDAPECCGRAMGLPRDAACEWHPAATTAPMNNFRVESGINLECRFRGSRLKTCRLLATCDAATGPCCATMAFGTGEQDNSGVVSAKCLR